ncbi:cytoskeletal protein RodZ [compost metagenome]
MVNSNILNFVSPPPRADFGDYVPRNSPGPSEPSVAAMTDLSLLLKETRQRYGLTLEDVAQRTYIKLPYLEALEDGRMDALPAPVYTYGYIRQYAKLLGLDGGELVARFQQLERGPIGPRHDSGPQRSLPPMPDDTYNYKPANGHGNGHGNGNGRSNGGFNQALSSLNGGEPAEVQQAKMQAQQILSAAEREAAQMIRGAEQYAAEVLANLEVEVAKSLQIIQNGRQYLHSRRQPGPQGY